MSPVDTYISQKGPAHTHRHKKHMRQFLSELSHPSIRMTPKESLQEEGVTSKGRASQLGVRIRDAVCPGLWWMGTGELWESVGVSV